MKKFSVTIDFFATAERVVEAETAEQAEQIALIQAQRDPENYVRYNGSIGDAHVAAELTEEVEE